jgi:hypothetical protein
MGKGNGKEGMRLAKEEEGEGNGCSLNSSAWEVDNVVWMKFEII